MKSGAAPGIRGDPLDVKKEMQLKVGEDADVAYLSNPQ